MLPAFTCSRVMALFAATLLTPAPSPAQDRAGVLAPPRVLGLDSSGSETAHFAMPADPLHAPVRQLRLRFDQVLIPMLVRSAAGEPAPGSFRVLSAGADGIVQTPGCAGTPTGDDVDMPIAALHWTLASFEATLTLGGSIALPADRYRVLACDSLLGLSGLALDGDGDGLAGGTASFDFSTLESPQLENPTFDDDVAGWNLSWGTADIAWDPRDADAAPHSGAMRIASGAGSSLLVSDTCVHIHQVPPAIPARDTRYRVRYRVQVLSGAVRSVATARFGFAGDMGEPDCIGPDVRHHHDGATRTAADGHALYDSGLQLAPLLPLAELRLEFSSADGQPFELLLDDVGLGFDKSWLFSGDFER